MAVWRADPDQLAGADRAMPRRALWFGGQDQIDLAAGKLRLEPVGIGRDQLDPQPWIGCGKALQHLRDRGVNHVMRHTQRDLARILL